PNPAPHPFPTRLSSDLFYRRIDGKTQALGVVNEVQIDRWSGEVELQTGKGIARRGGRYSVLLASAAEQSAASAIHDELENAGYADRKSTRLNSSHQIIS